MKLWKKGVDELAKFHLNLRTFFIFSLLALLIFTIDIWDIVDWHMVFTDARVVAVMMMVISYLTGVFLLWVPCKLSHYHSALLKAREVIYETLSIKTAAELKWILGSSVEMHRAVFLTVNARTMKSNTNNLSLTFPLNTLVRKQNLKNHNLKPDDVSPQIHNSATTVHLTDVRLKFLGWTCVTVQK